MPTDPDDGIAEEALQLADEVALDRELASRSLREYVEMAWPEVEPARPFIPNWHVDAICDVLEAVRRKDIMRLVINVPPGVGKSLLCSVFYQSWLWTDWPGAKVISTSYGEDIARRDCLRSRYLIESKWWQDRWGHQMTPRPANWTSTHFRNEQGGFRLAAGVGGRVTGEHGDIQMTDDPLKPLEVTGSMSTSKGALAKVLIWWSETMATRLTDDGRRIIIMQRLHEGDPAGEMLAAGGYHHLCLPMEYEPKAQPCPIKKCKATHDENADPRTEPGELLNKHRNTKEDVARLRKELGSRGAAAQLDQTPSPAEGAIFKKRHLRYYRRHELPGKFDKQAQSWDMTFKESGSSYVVGQVWGVKGPGCYLLDQVRNKWSFSDTVKQLKLLTIKWPKAHTKLVEAKANGPAVASALQKTLSGIKLIEPEGGKEARANAVEPTFESGHVWLPHPDEAPWVEGFVEELLGFPAVVNDDQVDCATQAINELSSNSLDKLRRAMANLNK